MTTVSRAAPAQTLTAAPFGRTMLAFTLAALLVSGQIYVVIPLLPDMAATWRGDPGSLTWLVTAFGAGYGVGFLLFGPLSDRLGRRRLLLAGLPVAAAGTALVALSPSPELALVLRAVQGVAVATFPPAALAYVAERVEPRRRVVAISAVTGAFLVSAVLLQIAAQVLVDVIGWRGLFALSAAGLVAAWLGLRAVMLPDGPAGSAGTPRPSGAGGSSRAERSSGAVVWKELPAAYRTVPALLRDGALLLRYAATVVLMAGFVALYTGLQLHGVTASSGELLALRAAGLPAMITVPLLMGRLGRVAAPARAVAMLAAGALVLAATALTGAAGMGLVLLLAAYAATVTGGLPSLNEAVSGRAGQARGTALALFSFSLAVGAGVGSQVAAAFGGFTALLYGLAALMGVAALAVLASTRR